MTESSVAEAKALVRAEVRAARSARETSAEESTRLSEQLGQYCLDHKVTVAAAYLPLPGEPNISEFLYWAKGNAIRLLMPVVTGQSLRWVEFDSETRVGELGFAEASGKPAAEKLEEAGKASGRGVRRRSHIESANRGTRRES